ncbi:hypothetical protein [Mycobacteroides salmoniphilum]|uniref:hypothetical protein n=1 Tax=Mycobacteroides salmoniphilum TaxID=404941 RepID=UPI0010651D00|nr:hypothetical protein [Mycobacteroides salmoniphilum]TDZ91155.1 hypothetical protein CCUG62472_04414 [Mycobacteroides salmoniphilum]
MITIRDGASDIIGLPEGAASSVAHLHIAAIRRFQQGKGFPVTFQGYLMDEYDEPTGQLSAWFHPGMTLVIDYGTAGPVPVQETEVAEILKSMDSSELGVFITTPRSDGAYPLLTTDFRDLR